MSVVSAAAYRGLLAEPALRRLAIADALARLPQGMVSLTVLLVAAEHASMAVAGLVVAGYTLGQAVTGPVRGRLADRHGLTKVAACCSLGYALALLAGAMTEAPTGLLVGAATTAGLVNPPLSPGMRSLWSARAGARLAPAAFALDAAVFDLAYITGPVLAGALATGLAPATGALLSSPVLGGAGASRPVLALVLAFGLAVGATVSAGGKQIDAVQILARELNGDEAGPPGPADVSVELVAGERTFRAASMVTVRGWGRKEPTEAVLAREYAEAVTDLAAWSSFRVLASVRGEPAAVDGCTLRGEVAHLWGAVTLPEYRRRGAYRAVLTERLRLARAHGATLALVKGRAETSGPILLRSGFALYSEERCYWLPVV